MAEEDHREIGILIMYAENVPEEGDADVMSAEKQYQRGSTFFRRQSNTLEMVAWAIHETHWHRNDSLIDNLEYFSSTVLVWPYDWHLKKKR